MSSHREAPEISKDPVADNADVYAFVSPDSPTTVTIVTNFVPLQGPAGGPNFYEFGDDVLYSIYIDNDGDAMPEIEYQFQFTSTLQNPNTFLYNTGHDRLARTDPGPGTPGSPTRSSGSTPASRPRSPAGQARRRAPAQARPGLQQGPDPLDGARNRPSVPAVQHRPAIDARLRGELGHPAVQSLPTGEKVFCGQRNDPFYVDLGVDLRPRRPAAVPAASTDPVRRPDAEGVDATKAAEHPHDRDPGPDLDAHEGRLGADERHRPLVRARHLERRQPAQGADVRRPQELRGRVGPVGAGLAPRQPALQRGDRAARREGRLEPRQPGRRLGVPAERPASPELASSDRERPLPEPRSRTSRRYHNARRADLVAILLTGIPDGVVNAVLPHVPLPTFTGTARPTPTCFG